MMTLVSKICFSFFLLLPILASQTTSTNSSELPYAPTPEPEHDTFSLEHYAPTPAPAPKTDYEEIRSPYYPSPPSSIETLAPVPVYGDYASLEAPVPPPSMPELSLPASETESSQAPPDADVIEPPPDEGIVVPQASILPSNYSSEDEVNEFLQEQDASWTKKNAAGGVAFGVIVGVCVVGLGGFVYKKKKDKRRMHYESLAKKEGI